MRRPRADAPLSRLLMRSPVRVATALALASLIMGSAPTLAGPTRESIEQTLRQSGLGADERRALRAALQGAIDQDPAGALARSAETADTATESSVDGVWARIPAPEPRAFHTAIHDPVRGRLIVFGGFDWWQGGRYDDVWALSLDGSPTWASLPTAPFGVRWGHAAIYDPIRDRMVVFGGSSPGGYQNDVWSLSLGGMPTWTQVSAAGTAPAPRLGSTAIYDPARDRMVLFGGRDPAGTTNEVWILSLGGEPAWSKITPVGPAPSARQWHSSICDPERDRLVVFGGYETQGETGDVWELSLSDPPAWNEVFPSGVAPGPKSRHTGVYDPERHQMVVFGGYSSDLSALSLGDTPEWTTLPTTLEGLDWSAAVYDPGHDAMVGFGGERSSTSIPSDAAWLLSLSSPGSVATIPAVGRTPEDLMVPPVVYDPARDRLIVGGRLPDTHVEGWWTLSLGETPAWRDLSALGTPQDGLLRNVIYDGLRDRLVALGRFGPSLAVWSLSLDASPTWAPITTSGTPPGFREGHTMVHDVLRDRIVIFGGGTFPAGPNNEVWILTLGDTPTWSQIVPSGTPPTPRQRHTAIYDPVRDRMVVSGGDGWWYPSQDVWALALGDTPTWTPIVAEGASPVYMDSHSAIYDPVRDRMVVFGGQSDPFSQAWALSLGANTEWSPLAPAGPLPIPRCYHGAAYDPVRDRMLIVGGSSHCSTPESLHDVWTLTWGTPLLPPSAISAEPGAASITVSWAPSPSANVVGYRIVYGTQLAAVRFGGDQAAEGPSGIQVPAAQTSITLSCMPDSVFEIAIQTVGASGGRSAWSLQVLARPDMVGGALAVHPPTVNPGSQGRWVSAVMEPGDGYPAGQIVLESLLLNDALAPEQVATGDANENGVPDLSLKFARADVMALIPPGAEAEIRVTGKLAGCEDTLTCSVRDTIRLIQPGVSNPVAGVMVPAGDDLEIAWTLPGEIVVDSVVVLVSVDNQQSWEVVGRGQAGWSTCPWAPSVEEAESCYVAVAAFVGGDVMGVGYGGPFAIGATVAASPMPERFELHGARPSPFRAGGRIAFGVPLATRVTLQVFDLSGRLVETLVNGPVPAGPHEVVWSARGVGAGVFFVQLRGGSARASRRLVLLR